MKEVAAALLVLAFAGAASAGDEKAAKLTGYDAIVRPGETARLRARLERIGYLGVNPSVEGEVLDFFVVPRGTSEEAPPRFLTSGKTDSSGYAEVEFAPKEAGLHELEVRIRKGAPYIGLPARVFVLAPAPGGRTFVTDLEQTLADLSAVKFMTAEPKSVKEVEGACDALKALAASHAPIYVTGVESTFVTKVKEWLRLKGFPDGPVFAWDIAKNALSGETYKTNLIGKLKTDAGGLAFGIGGKAEDAVACARGAITPYYVGQARDKDLPPEAIWAKSWPEVPELVKRQLAVEEQLRDLAGQDKAKQDAAQKELSRLEAAHLGFLARFLRASDHAVAAAASLTTARIRAREAFAASLDTSSPNSALASVEAAWTQGDEVVIARLYRGGAKSAAKAGPALAAWRGIEIVTRCEPEPGRVVYRLRFLPVGEGSPAERDYSFVRGDDGRWWVDVTVD